jgi:hypothetical protein
MTGTRRTLPAILAVGLLLVTAACGDDSSDDDDEASSSSEPTSTTTTTHPSTEDDEEAAFDTIRALVGELDGLNEQLYGDPSVVEDPDNPDLRRLNELFIEEHTGPEDTLEDLERLNELGNSQTAAPSGVYGETYIYGLESEDPDTVVFGYCTVRDRLLLDDDGTQMGQGEAQQMIGTSKAHRVGGIWRLGFDESQTPQEIPPGSAQPGQCETMLAEQPEEDQP